LQAAIYGSAPLPGGAGYQGGEFIAELLGVVLHGGAGLMVCHYMVYHVSSQGFAALVSGRRLTLLPSPDCPEGRRHCLDIWRGVLSSWGKGLIAIAP
jgi:hypothetical protein